MTELEEQLMQSLTQLQQQYEEQFGTISAAMISLREELASMSDLENTNGRSGSRKNETWQSLREEWKEVLARKDRRKSLCVLCEHVLLTSSINPKGNEEVSFRCLLSHEEDVEYVRCSKFEVSGTFGELNGLHNPLEQPLFDAFGSGYLELRRKYTGS